MGYGPLSLSNITTIDMVSPGMPVFTNATQVDNTVIRLTIALPSIDATGGNLSGLSKLTVVSLPMPGSTNPFQGKSMVECLAMSGVQKIDVTVSTADAGQEKMVDVMVMNLGGVQAFAAACAD